jgi:predicted enzyme related to lactoylglutathione lyase
VELWHISGRRALKHRVTWFEIPVIDLERAAAFYEALFGVELLRDTVADIPHATFPVDEGGVTGALVTRAPTSPGPHGATVYLACESVEVAIERALSGGGALVMPGTTLSNIGTIGAIRDPDGNVIGLHAVPVAVS